VPRRAHTVTATPSATRSVPTTPTGPPEHHPIGLPGWLPWRDVIVPWAASRLVALVTITVAGVVHDDSPTGSWLRAWDGSWYTSIAADGYGAPPVPGQQSAWPFFPLLPGLIRGFDAIGLDGVDGALVVNQLALLLALAGVWRLASTLCTARGARLAVWAMAVFPLSFVHSMLYPSAIFFAASTWAFAFAAERRDVLAAASALVATAVRPNGLVVAAILASAALLAVGAAGRTAAPAADDASVDPSGHRHGRPDELAIRARRALVLATPSALFFGGWLLWLRDRTGDALAFWHAKSAWDEITIIEFLRMQREHLRVGADLPHVIVGGGALLLVALVVVRLPLDWLALVALTVVPAAIVGVVGLGRYAGECFPVGVAAGMLGERLPRAVPPVLLVASTAAMVWIASLVVVARYVP
jgi:hypothetical protein